MNHTVCICIFIYTGQQREKERKSKGKEKSKLMQYALVQGAPRRLPLYFAVTLYVLVRCTTCMYAAVDPGRQYMLLLCTSTMYSYCVLVALLCTRTMYKVRCTQYDVLDIVALERATRDMIIKRRAAVFFARRYANRGWCAHANTRTHRRSSEVPTQALQAQ